jgi:hypothetical protein
MTGFSGGTGLWTTATDLAQPKRLGLQLTKLEKRSANLKAGTSGPLVRLGEDFLTGLQDLQEEQDYAIKSF